MSSKLPQTTWNLENPIKKKKTKNETTKRLKDANYI